MLNSRQKGLLKNVQDQNPQCVTGLDIVKNFAGHPVIYCSLIYAIIIGLAYVCLSDRLRSLIRFASGAASPRGGCAYTCTLYVIVLWITQLTRALTTDQGTQSVQYRRC